MQVQLICQEFSLYYGDTLAVPGGEYHIGSAHVVDDHGNLVPCEWDGIMVYTLDQFKSITAAREFHGLSLEPEPIPAII